jgi:hypothetical protein
LSKEVILVMMGVGGNVMLQNVCSVTIHIARILFAPSDLLMLSLWEGNSRMNHDTEKPHRASSRRQ